MKFAVRCAANIALLLSPTATAQEQKPVKKVQQAFAKELEKQLNRVRRIAIVIGIDAYAIRAATATQLRNDSAARSILDRLKFL